MAEPKRQKPVWYVVGCVGLAILCVPCIGILAAIAIPAFVNYARRSKTQEAVTNLHMIATAVEYHCMEEQFPPAPSMFPDAVGPSTAHPDPTRQIQDFSAGPWAEVDFAPNDPLYYAYSMERPDASSLHIVAEGDLDGDGVRSHFEIDCTANGPGACTCGELLVTNELE